MVQAIAVDTVIFSVFSILNLSNVYICSRVLVSIWRLPDQRYSIRLMGPHIESISLAISTGFTFVKSVFSLVLVSIICRVDSGKFSWYDGSFKFILAVVMEAVVGGLFLFAYLV